MRKTITFFLALLISAISYAQLQPGDIAFIGYNADATASNTEHNLFSWIALTDIPANTTINFTDIGAARFSFLDTGEGIIAWSSSSPVNAGQIISVRFFNAGSRVFASTIGTMTVIEDGFDLSDNGDQIIAFTGSPTSTSIDFIAGINADHSNNCTNLITEWADSTSCFFIAENENQSVLPDDLSNQGELENGSFYAVSIVGDLDDPSEFDNAKYIGTLTGSHTDVRRAINDRRNWQYSNANLFLIEADNYSGIPDICLGATIPVIDTDVNSATVCDDNLVTITIDGDLRNADVWRIYRGELGTSNYDNNVLVGETSTNTFEITQEEYFGRYFVRGEFFDTNSCAPGAVGDFDFRSEFINEYTRPIFSYDQNSFFSDDDDPVITINNPDHVGGTFTSTPEGLSLNPNTGEVDISESILGKSYEITYEISADCAVPFSTFITIIDPLKEGDIAFIGFQTFGDVSAFTWIALKDISSSQQINFTTQGVDENGFMDNRERHITWDSRGVDIPAGTIVQISERTNSNGSTNDFFANIGEITRSFGSASSLLSWDFSDDGDQIIAYSRNSFSGAVPDNPTFIAALNTNYEPSSCFDTSTNWNAIGCTDDNLNESILPNGLTNGENAISFLLENGTRTGKYNGPLSGNSDDLRLEINNTANWTTSILFLGIEPTDYTVGEVCFATETLVSYSSDTYSSDDTDPFPTIDGLTGGVFSTVDGITSNLDLSIDPNTGEIDLSASDFGTHTILYTLQNDCDNNSFTTQFNVTINDASLSVNDITDAINNIKVYKSSEETITISGLNFTTDVTVYSLLGQQIAHKTIRLGDANTINIPTSVSPGIYVVRLDSEKGIITKKIILD